MRKGANKLLAMFMAASLAVGLLPSGILANATEPTLDGAATEAAKETSEVDTAEPVTIGADVEILEAGSDGTFVEETTEVTIETIETENYDTEDLIEGADWEAISFETETEEDTEEEIDIKALSADDEILPLDGETVAKIGDQEYTSIQDAIDAAGTVDTTITMTADTAEDITINSDQTITLDMSGYTISFQYDGNNHDIILNYGTLTVKNGTVTGGLSSERTGGIANYEGSNLTVDGVTFLNTAGSYGNVYFEGGNSLNISGCDFEGSTSLAPGVCIYLRNATGEINISDCICRENKTTGGQGGAIYAYHCDNTISISDCTICDNTTPSPGGAIYADTCVIDISGCNISDNVSQSGPGGGIYATGCTINISDSTISGHKVETATPGGGIYVSGSNLNILNCTISDNSSGYGGGGIFVNDMGSTLTIEGSKIIGNSTSGYGGGIFNNGTCTLINTVVSGNTAENSGGGVENAKGSLIMEGGAIYGNTAGNAGADCHSNASITLVDAASMKTDGYPVTGWYYDKEDERYADKNDPVEYTPIASDEDDLYLIAAYAVTVSYDLNGGSGIVPEDSTSKDESASGTAASDDGLTAPEGYCQFTGWNTAADGSGTSYEAGAEYSFMKDTILYAQWSEHTYSGEGEVTKPTCTEQGYTTYTCTVCGQEYKTDYTDATGHSWNDGVVIKEATATEDGEILYTCTVCGATRTETIAATGNNGSGEGNNGNNGSGSGSGTGGTVSGSGSGSENGGTENGSGTGGTESGSGSGSENGSTGSGSGTGGTGSGSGSTNSTESTGTTNVKTADTNTPILYGILVALAGAAIVTLGLRRRIL